MLELHQSSSSESNDYISAFGGSARLLPTLEENKYQNKQKTSSPAPKKHSYLPIHEGE